MWDLRSLQNNVWVVQFIFLVPLEKGALKFEMALELFMGGNPWKRES